MSMAFVVIWVTPTGVRTTSKKWLLTSGPPTSVTISPNETVCFSRGLKLSGVCLIPFFPFTTAFGLEHMRSHMTDNDSFCISVELSVS